MYTAHLCGLLQGLHGEGEVPTLGQVIIVHALGHFGDGVIAGQPLPPQLAQLPSISVCTSHANKLKQADLVLRPCKSCWKATGSCACM